MKVESRPDARNATGSSEASLRVFLLNTKDVLRNPDSYMTLALAEGLRAHLGRDSVKIVTNGNVVEEAYENPPSALICFEGEEVQFDIILEIRKMGIPRGRVVNEGSV